MRDIDNYISEKLVINRDFKINHVYDLDSFTKYLTDNGLRIVKDNPPRVFDKIYKKDNDYPWCSFSGYDIFFVLNDTYIMDKFEFKFHKNQWGYDFIGLEKYDTTETDNGHIVLKYTKDNADKLIELFNNAANK